MRRASALAIAGVAMALAAGTAGAASPPETTITSGPTGSTPDPAPSFSFASDQPDAGFECRLDGGTWTLRAPAPVLTHLFDPRWEPCASPTSYPHIEDGAHLFEVRSVSSEGVFDPSPAARSFVVDTSVAVTLSWREKQRQRRRGIQIKVRISAGERLDVGARGEITVRRKRGRERLRVKLRRRALSVPAGRARLLRLQPDRRSDARRVASALRRDRRANARVSVRLSNSLGNSVAERLDVELRSR